MKIKILQETYNKLLVERTNKLNLIKEAVLLVEKMIAVGDGLEKKLKFANTSFSNKILAFLKSDKIKETSKITKLDFEKDDEKTFTVYQETQRGESKGKQKILKLLKSLGADLSTVKAYEVEELIGILKKGDISNLQIVSGEKVRWAYFCDNYDEGFMGSCMSGKHAQKYLDMYTRNPKQVSCLVLLNPENGKVRGRALLWTLDDGTKYMDRVYATNNQYKTEFSNYVEQHGINKGTPTADITLENKGAYEYYPYMDTFMYYNVEEGVLSEDDDYDSIQIQDTGGGESTCCYSEMEGERIPEDEATYVDQIDDYVWHYDAVWSEEEEEVLYKHHDDTVELHDGKYALKSSAVYMEDEEEWALYEDTVTLIDDESTLFDNAMELYDEQWALRNDDEVVELYNGEFAHDGYHEIITTYDDKVAVYDMATKLYNGTWALDDDETLVKLFDNKRYAISTDKNLITINGKYVPSNEVVKEPDGTYSSKPISQIKNYEN